MEMQESEMVLAKSAETDFEVPNGTRCLLVEHGEWRNQLT